MISGIVLGLVVGLTYGLLATGIVLVYKTNRFLNLAHAQFGVLSALILGKVVLEAGWSWWAAFPVVVALGAGIGMLVERTVIRTMIKQKRTGTTMLLVSLGVAQVLLALTYVPAIGPDVSILQVEGYPVPLDARLVVGPVVLLGQHILVLVLVPLIIAGLAVFLGYTVWGKAIRACAANPEAARLCGIPLRKINALSWALAGGLSAVSAVLQAPSQGTFNASALGPELLLLALGAAALGGFTSIPLALAGGLLLGLVEQITLANSSSTGPAQLVLFLVVIGIVSLRATAIASSGIAEGSAGEEAAPVRVPASIKDRAIVKHQRGLLIGGSLSVAALLPVLPYLNTTAHRFALVIILVMSIVSVALTLVIGWAGQVSLGHYALLGLGAYLTAKLQPQGLSLPLLILFAALAGAFTMVVVGLPALRTQGLGLALTTLGLAVVAPGYLFQQKWLGAPGNAPVLLEPSGYLSFTYDSLLELYYVALLLLAVFLYAASSLRRSLPGQLVLAVRDNPKAVAGYGVSPGSVRLGILAVSGAFVASAGVVWGLAWQTMSIDLVPAQLSLVVLALPVIGGLGSLPGAVAGAVAIYAPAFFLSPYLTVIFGDFGKQLGFQLALAGAGLILIPLTQPQGIAGAMRDGWQRMLNSIASDVERTAPDVTGPPLAVADIRKRFGKLEVLGGIDLDVQPGEIVGLIGPNGAGKTTLMNIISGHLDATSGDVTLFGKHVAALPPDQRAQLGLGRNFQEARLFPGLTLREALRVAIARTSRVGLLSALTGAPWVSNAERHARRRVDRVIEAFGLTAYRDTLTSDLSTGTRRIVELAAQAAAGPKVLLLDEPTAGVAQREAEAFGPLLRRIREELDCSILIIEHDMPLLMGLCDRVYALAGGQVLAVGTPEEVRNDPQVIASYLGSNDVAVERSGATGSRDGGDDDPSAPGGGGRADEREPDLVGAGAGAARGRPARTPRVVEQTAPRAATTRAPRKASGVGKPLADEAAVPARGRAAGRTPARGRAAAAPQTGTAPTTATADTPPPARTRTPARKVATT